MDLPVQLFYTCNLSMNFRVLRQCQCASPIDRRGGKSGWNIV